jgi:hypothetical protein
VTGLAVAVFAAVALAGPGRIDIVDGQTRFEVGRSLVEHGDSVLRDPRIWWSSFPGRGGEHYTYYRFPHSAVAALAVAAADATGPVAEGRRHFVFALSGAAVAALLAIIYAAWFRSRGCSPRAALGWAAAGIACTPCWFYATSTFDDVLGTAVVVAAVAVAAWTRDRQAVLGAIAAGLLLGLAFNCKPPLGAFVLVALAAHDDPSNRPAVRFARAALIVAGLALGAAAEMGYDRYKFPPGSKELHAELLTRYYPNWPGDPVAALACLALSPGAGALWYCPPLPLGIAGWARGAGRRLAVAFAVSAAAFVLFFCALTIFKGDPCWGPRYLTPVFGLAWLFAPDGAARFGPRAAGLLLAAGAVVQVLALSVDMHRLYIEQALPSAFSQAKPWLLFHPGAAHLVNRPREILEVLRSPPAPEFTPAPTPTFAPPLIDPPELPVTGPPGVARYEIFRGWRPWWLSFRWLPPDQRPVDLDRTAGLLLALLAAGLALVALSRPAPEPGPAAT